MSNDDLKAAAKAARDLASTAATIRALREDGQTAVATKLLHDLNRAYPEARAAIGRVATELKRARGSTARLGDAVAPTAHEAAVEMVHTLNREHFGMEIVGRKQAWPDADAVMAEIEVEYAKASERREQRKSKKRTGRPRKGEADKFALVEAALVKHHGYQQGGSVANDEAASLAQLAKLADGQFSKATVSRFMKAQFGDRGYKAYQQACVRRHIGSDIARWRGELSREFVEKLVEERIRRQKDD